MSEHTQLIKDLARHLQQRVIQAGVDCSDASLGVSVMDAIGILISGADALLKMAAGIHAATLGEKDPIKAFNSTKSYAFIINSLKEARDRNAS